MRHFLDQLGDKLARVGTGVKARPDLGGLLDGSLDHGLSILQVQSAVSGGGNQLLQALGDVLNVVQHDKALDHDSGREDLAPVVQLHGLAHGVVRANSTAHGNGAAAEALHARQHGVEHGAADVVVVQVDLGGGGGLEVLDEGRATVVDALGGANLLDPGALLVGASDAHDALDPEDPGRDLHNHGARGARRRRHHDGLVRVALGAARVDQARVGRQARAAKGAQVVRQRQAPGQRRQQLARVVTEDGVLAPRALVVGWWSATQRWNPAREDGHAVRLVDQDPLPRGTWGSHCNSGLGACSAVGSLINSQRPA
jgi:hypothetical protein